MSVSGLHVYVDLNIQSHKCKHVYMLTTHTYTHKHEHKTKKIK